MAFKRTTTSIHVDAERGVFMISVAAELAEMHPQTLRMYEQRGLIEPQRSPKGTRLYSQRDVDRLRQIQQMTTDLGMNLAGVERVLELENELEQAKLRYEQATAQLQRMQAETLKVKQHLEAQINELRRSTDLVPYTATTEIVRIQRIG